METISNFDTVSLDKDNDADDGCIFVLGASLLVVALEASSSQENLYLLLQLPTPPRIATATSPVSAASESLGTWETFIEKSFSIATRLVQILLGWVLPICSILV